MSLKKVTQLRADKGFRPADLIVYAAIIILIVALFIAFVFNRGSGGLASVSVLKGFGQEQHTVCTYNFTTDSLSVLDSDVISVVESGEERIVLRFSSREGEYNLICIDKSAVSVSVTEANCPALDCVYTAAITSESSLPIICSTHGMIIRADSVSGSVIQ